MTETRIFSSGLVLCLLVGIAFGDGAPDVTERPAEDFRAFRRGQTSQLERALARISTSADGAQAVAAGHRMAEIADELVADVLACYRQVREQADEAANEMRADELTPTRASEMAKLYDVYRRKLGTAGRAITDTQSAHADQVLRYGQAVLAAAERFVLTRGRELAGADGVGSVPAEGAIVVCLLRRPEPDAAAALVDGLPEWMADAPLLSGAEDVCLFADRPSVAYLLWSRGASPGGGRKARLQRYFQGLDRRANACFASKDFLNGIAVLKSLVALAETEELIDAAVRARFRLATVYAMYGHNELAAAEMKRLMAEYPDHAEYGRAALVRLRHLYESGDLETILAEAPELIEDQSVGKYRAQILYIAWVANRRTGRSKEADTLGSRLVSDHAESPLCADVHFAAAMELLATGDYASASKLLDRIVERYPETRIADKSRAIRARIRQAENKEDQSATRPSDS